MIDPSRAEGDSARLDSACEKFLESLDLAIMSFNIFLHCLNLSSEWVFLFGTTKQTQNFLIYIFLLW